MVTSEEGGGDTQWVSRASVHGAASACRVLPPYLYMLTPILGVKGPHLRPSDLEQNLLIL